MAKKSSVDHGAIEIQIAPAYADTLAEDRLRVAAEAVLRHEGKAGQVTLVITDDEGIRELNRDFLGQDVPTDVLAFAAHEGDESFVASPEVDDYLGDVIISYPRAVAQATEMGHSLDLELSLLVVHGLLHLLGYDHAHEGEKTIMWASQDTILQSL